MNGGRGARLPSAHAALLGFTPGRGIVYRAGEDGAGEGRGGDPEGAGPWRGSRGGEKIAHLSRNKLH